MGYSNAVTQKQTAEKGDSFSGVNAQRKMGAVPVLQRVEEGLKDVVMHQKNECSILPTTVKPQQQLKQLKKAHFATHSIQMMKRGGKKFQEANGNSLDKLRADIEAEKVRKRNQGWVPGLHDHIFKGDNTEKDKIKGFHSTIKAATAVLEKTGDADIGAHGVYKSTVRDKNKHENTKLSTFFPDGITEDQIRVAINMRGVNGYPTEGPMQNIHIAMPGDGTAYPDME